MENTNTALQQKSGVMPEQVAAQPSNDPRMSVKFPEGPGVLIAGSAWQGVYMIMQSAYLKQCITSLQSRISPPLEIVAWVCSNFRDMKRQADHLRRLFPGKRTDDGWFRLTPSDLAQARAYLAEERERLAREAEHAIQEAAKKLEQAAKARENAIDDCLQLINRVRMMAEVVRSSMKQECRIAKCSWPQQQATDECLQLVEHFHATAGKFDAALSRVALEIQLARMPKTDAALSVM